MADICTFPCEFQPGFGKDRINRLGLAPTSADKKPRCFDDYKCDYIHVLTTVHIPEPLLAEDCANSVSTRTSSNS